MAITKADSVVQLDQNFLVFYPRWRSFLCYYKISALLMYELSVFMDHSWFGLFLYFLHARQNVPRAWKRPKLSLTNRRWSKRVRYGQKIDPLWFHVVKDQKLERNLVIMAVRCRFGSRHKKGPLSFCPFRICRPLPSSIVKWTRDSSEAHTTQSFPRLLWRPILSYNYCSDHD